MHFRASDVFAYSRPSACGLRVYLRHHDVAEGPRSPFDDLLAALGEKHEKSHLRSLPAVVDLSSLSQDERERRTLLEIRAGAPALYQPRLRARIALDGEPCEIVGEPDFLIREGDGYLIRDSKLARRIGNGGSAITLQLQLYGWLYERATGAAVRGLEVHAGSGQIVPVPFDGGGAALGALRFLRGLRLAGEEPWEPVGWSKCGGCGYRERCWSLAEGRSEVALLPGVSQVLARKLRTAGVTSFHDLEQASIDPALEEIFYERNGKGEKKLQRPFPAILRSALAMTSGMAQPIAAPALPDPTDCVLFDLEGMPFLDDLDKIYLWGLKIRDGNSSRYQYALADFNVEGDRQGWRDFLELAGRLLGERPSRRFVHFGSYEKTKLTLYASRFGDPDGTAARILESLFDLHKALTESFALPVSSYGLKVIEKYVGFTRRLPESRGDWAMARYIEAVEAPDPVVRSEIMKEILAYNEEDLDATGTVLEWMRSRPEAWVRDTPAPGL